MKIHALPTLISKPSSAACGWAMGESAQLKDSSERLLQAAPITYNGTAKSSTSGPCTRGLLASPSGGKIGIDLRGDWHFNGLDSARECTTADVANSLKLLN